MRITFAVDSGVFAVVTVLHGKAVVRTLPDVSLVPRAAHIVQPHRTIASAKLGSCKCVHGKISGHKSLENSFIFQSYLKTL
ncbi:hypothetical protein DPMN_069558 [Dreissena polymorpha]|uniref:Uncharacterized protein n=1 Tax=Dreissena polymorpha TaxID=45954 RepID=A0A9D3Z1D0_DREPO|nr:hypothetical protein DPMN_069558 [Dreissena polymorpha]